MTCQELLAAFAPERAPPPTRFLPPLAARLAFFCLALHTSQNHIPSGTDARPIQLRWN